MKLLKSFLCGGLSALALSGVCADVTVTPVVTDAALENPGMGLVFYHFANRLWAYGSELEPGDTLANVPGTTVVYLRVLWKDIEPTEGLYRWDILDSVAQNWIAKGKKVAFRFICSNQTENATPGWVRAAGAKCTDFFYTRGDATAKAWRWEPVYDDPVFLAKLEAFLMAFAGRYDGDPNVAFVDVGSFGMYGEGHTGYSVKLSQDEMDRISKIHVDLHLKCLPKTYLVISDDISGASNTAPDAKMMKYCRERGVGFRDDSIFCFSPKSKFDGWAHDGWARLFAPTLPVVVETGHYCGKAVETKNREWKYDRLVACAEAYRASYFSIHGFPDEVIGENAGQYRELARRVGYRFVPKSITYPSEVSPGEPVSVRSTWVNVGVAPCHAGAALTWSLTDAKGAVVWSSTDASFDFKVLEPTIGGVERPQEVTSACRFGLTQAIADDCDLILDLARARGRARMTVLELLKPGTYALNVSAGSKQGTPTIALPLENGVGRRYPVGKITVKGGR